MSAESLLQAARDAASRAYAPYSKFRVGAAVLAGGKIWQGCNVENASYGLSVCAERNAIFNAVCSGAREIEAIAVTCPDADANAPQTSRMPCGACRQVIAEFASQSLTLIIDEVGEITLAELLPKPFILRA
jgi:cytidine deaminase